MGLAVLSGKMTAISLHLRQVASPGHPISKGAVSPVIEAGERCATLQPLEAMAVPRCAFGVCVWNDSFVVCGAYLWIIPPPTSHPCVWVGRVGIYVFAGAYMLIKLQVLQRVLMGFYAV